jgi:hypothetical protein
MLVFYQQQPHEVEWPLYIIRKMQASINTRVRATSKSFVCDAEIQHQRHRAHHIREVASQLDVPTSMTPAPGHLLRFHFVGCAKVVSDLINRPVVSLLGTRVDGASAEVVTKRVYLKPPATTSREQHFRKERDLDSNRRRKEGLSETRRPGLIFVIRSDLPQPTHRHEP